MKKLFIVLSLALVPALSFGQAHLAFGRTQADYESMVRKFIRYYNKMQVDSLCHLMAPKWDNDCQWNANDLEMMRGNAGKVIKYTYIGPFQSRVDAEGNPMVYFKLEFDKVEVSSVKSANGKKIHAACFTIDNNNKILQLAFTTASRSIDSMILKY